jgi:hypothetical protein
MNRLPVASQSLSARASLVAGARNHQQVNKPLGFCFEIPV